MASDPEIILSNLDGESAVIAAQRCCLRALPAAYSGETARLLLICRAMLSVLTKVSTEELKKQLGSTAERDELIDYGRSSSSAHSAVKHLLLSLNLASEADRTQGISRCLARAFSAGNKYKQLVTPFGYEYELTKSDRWSYEAVRRDKVNRPGFTGELLVQ